MTDFIKIKNEIDNSVQHSLEYTTHENVIAEYQLDILNETYKQLESDIFYFNFRDMRCNGFYHYDKTLVLFVTKYSTLENEEIDIELIELLSNFKQNLSRNLIDGLDDGNPNLDNLEYILSLLNDRTISVELALFSNANIINYNINHVRIFDLNNIIEHFDIAYNKNYINFIEMFGKKSEKIKVVDLETNNNTYLFFIPGYYLAKIYEQFREKLLTSNIRFYLKATSKINKAVLQTIQDEPMNFVSYNNGISATCNEVKVEDGTLISIEGLQIVNGGQTTVNLFEAYSKELPLEHVYVQCKLTLVKDVIHRSTLVGFISRYANTQNSIKMDDLSSNDTFFIELEKISRITDINSSQSTLNTRWFFERVRGQYEIEHSQNTKIDFGKLYPKSLKFTKSDLAKFIMSWEQYPNEVSKGAQKNFMSFSTILAKTSDNTIINNVRYHQIISLALLFNTTDHIIKDMGLGYKNVITTYTIALYSHLSNRELDYEAMWKSQNIDSKLQLDISNLATLVSDRINYTVASLKDPNVSTWAKKDKCWEDIKTIEYELISKVNSSKIELLYIPKLDLSKFSDDFWWKLAKWGKDTEILNPNERKMAASVAQMIAKKKNLSKKQLSYAESILLKSLDNGFEEFYNTTI